MVDFDLPKYWLFQKGKKKTRRQKNTTHTATNCSHLVYMWWMRPRETYSAEYHTTHDFDLPINYTVFSRKKKSEDIHNKTHTTDFFSCPFCMQSIRSNKIIALNFISKTNDSEQLITKNPQRTKKKRRSTNSCLINKNLKTTVRALV